MGFGYLLLGYLTAFLLKLTANQIGVGAAALALGYALMARGLFTLRHYCSRFTAALWALLPLSLLAIYELAKMFCDLFLWNPVWINETVINVISWLTLLFLVAFHAALLSAIRELASQVELPKLAAAAVRNLLFFGLYVVFYVFVKIPIFDRARPYLIICATIVNVACLLLNLWLLLSCMKNICPEGEEEPQRHRYRWDLLNKIGDKYAEMQEKAVEKQRREQEERLRRRREKREKKQRK